MATLVDKAVHNPSLFCTSLKRQQFYIFMRSEPEYVPILNLHLLFCAGVDAGPQRRVLSTETAARNPAMATSSTSARHKEQAITAATWLCSRHL